MTPGKVAYFFASFCPISGSPIDPTPQTAIRYESGHGLPQVSGGQAEGIIHHCCWPCICDSLKFLRVDTKTVSTSQGPHQFRFLVYGNPCTDPTRIPAEATDVTCSNGRLEASVLSDHGHVIVGMLQDNQPSIGASSREVLEACRQRAAAGNQSGMGTIFIDLAGINPL